MKFPRRRPRKDLDSRVEDAFARADLGREEAARSRARREVVRERVIGPQRAAAEHNQFSAMIRATLREAMRREAEDPG